MFNYNRGNAKIKLYSYILPPLITFLGMVLIMAIKHIEPFGSMGFGYNDNMHQVVPMYSFIWDVMHGRASSAYSIQIGMGTDLSVMRSTYSLFSPFNLLLYIIPRSYIVGFISIMTAVKMSCMAFSMFFFFNHDKVFAGTSYAFKVLFSVMYAFGGYALLYASCFSPWMDIAAIFPIFMLSFNKMLDTGNKLFYVIMTSFMLVVNSRLAFMAIIYAAVMTGGYMIFIVNSSPGTFRDKAHEFGKTASNMLAGTAAGLGIAAFVVIPCVMKVLGNKNDAARTLIKDYIELLTIPEVHTQYYMFRNFMVIYGLAFAFAIIVVGILFYKKEKRNTRYIIFSLAVTMLPIVFNGIERLWSIKSYQGYSMHFGFITIFAIISAGAYFAGKPLLIDGKKAEHKIETSFEPLEKLVYVLSGMVLCGIAAYIYNKIHLENVTSGFIYFAVVFVLMFGCDVAMCVVNKGILCAKSCYVATAIEIFIGAYAMMGVPAFYDLSEAQSANHAIIANHVSSVFDIKASHEAAVKNPDLSLGMNYSLILQRPAITSDFESYNDNFADAAAFGYGMYSSGATDAGGTVFSDTLLNIRNVVSMGEQEDALYQKTSEADGFNLYSAKFTLPYGMTIDSSLLADMDADDWISVNNAFYGAVLGRTDNIAGRCEVVQQSYGRYMVEAQGRCAVYLKIDSDIAVNIWVNRRLLPVPEIGNTWNTLYRMDDERLLFLGVFEDEEIEVILTDAGGVHCEADLQAGRIDLEKLAVVCNMMNSNKGLSADTYEISRGSVIKMQAHKINGRDMLIIPVTYDDNWRIQINGVSSKPIYIGNKMFIGIKLEEGQNKIELSYIPAGIELGMAISILTVLFMIGIYSLTRKNLFKLPEMVTQVFCRIFMLVWAVIMLTVFVLPVIADLVNIFR